MVAYTDDELDSWIGASSAAGRFTRDGLRAFTEGWRPPADGAEEWAGATPRRARRAGVAAAASGEVLVIPNGVPKIRTSDLFYPFRPATDHMWLVGPTEPGSVLVIDSDGSAYLYLDERPPLGHPLAVLDGHRGAVWDGPAESLSAASIRLGLEVRPIGHLQAALQGRNARGVLGLDPKVDELIADDDGELERHLARKRLVKDEYEIGQLREAACAAIEGFEAVGRSLEEVIRYGEAFVEGLFTQYARTRGRGVAYTPIAGGGGNATVLHWFKNDGGVRPGELLLLDAGVEGPELYSSDVTRTLPVSGRFTTAQKDIYDVVHAAQAAALAAVRPGAPYASAGIAAREVLVEGLRSLKLVPHPGMSQLSDEEAARRWTLHAIGHMLGADVHDCNPVIAEYMQADYEVGHVLTIEPGLYFSPYDDWAPEEVRGIGVRIEDDVVVTPDGFDILTAGLPRASDDVESWLDGLAIR